jgi:hypothetical protein
MGLLDKYSRPPTTKQLSDGNDIYEPVGDLVSKQQADPFMNVGGGLPMPYDYAPPRQQWSGEMMDRLMDTDIDTFDKEGKRIGGERPQLWLFETKAFRHFQLSNLSSRAQAEIERDIADIQMLANQDGNECLCQEIQIRVYAKIAMYKSRGDMPVPIRERDAWITNVSEIKNNDVPRPAGNGGGFFSKLLGGGNRDRY